MTHPIVALDIGSTKVACAIGLPRAEGSGYELLGSSLVSYPAYSEAWLSDTSMVSKTIAHALEEAGAEHGLSEVVVAISHPQLVSESVRYSIPLADEPRVVRTRDLERLQELALHQVLGMDREPLVVQRLGCSGNGFDGIQDPRGLCATRLSGVFHVVTMPMAARQRLVHVVESVGLEIVQLTHSLIATAAEWENTQPLGHFLIIDVGGLSTDIGFFNQGRLQASKTLSWGGLTLALTIARALHLTMTQALAVSLEALATHREQIREAIQEPLENLARALRELLDDQAQPERVAITGRGALMDGFAEWVEQTVGLAPSLLRNPRTQAITDLSKQVGLNSAMGLLDRLMRNVDTPTVRSAHFWTRFLDQTKTLLTEYF